VGARTQVLSKKSHPKGTRYRKGEKNDLQPDSRQPVTIHAQAVISKIVAQFLITQLFLELISKFILK